MRPIFTIVALIFTLSLSAQIGKAEENIKWVTIGVADRLVGTPKLSKTEGGNLYDLYYSNLEYVQMIDTCISPPLLPLIYIRILYNEFASVFNSKSKRNKKHQCR